MRSENQEGESVEGDGKKYRFIRFRDADGNSWRGWWDGTYWNGWVNVIVPSGESARMILAWKRSMSRSEWRELGKLPSERNFRINGRLLRGRDFSGGYAFDGPLDDGEPSRRE